MTMQVFSQVLQIVLQLATIATLSYTAYKFLSRPHSTLEEKVDAHEVDIKEIKNSLKQGNDRFREQSNTNDVIIHSLLALIEFEVQYCLLKNEPMSKGLEKAKEDLNNFLARR